MQRPLATEGSKRLDCPHFRPVMTSSIIRKGTVDCPESLELGKWGSFMV